MGNWLDIHCPGCKQTKVVAPGGSYKICEKCATPHCVFESGTCKVPGCNGWLKEISNPS